MQSRGQSIVAWEEGEEESVNFNRISFIKSLYSNFLLFAPLVSSLPSLCTFGTFILFLQMKMNASHPMLVATKLNATTQLAPTSVFVHLDTLVILTLVALVCKLTKSNSNICCAR